MAEVADYNRIWLAVVSGKPPSGNRLADALYGIPIGHSRRNYWAIPGVP